MDTTATHAGIDIAEAKFDVGLWPGGERLSFEYDDQGIDALIEKLRPLPLEVVALEATGGLETELLLRLAAAGLPVAVVDPAKVRAYAKALGKRAKTDPIDAEVIARFAKAAEIEVRPLPDAATRGLAALVDRRRQVIEMIVAEKLRRRRADERTRASIDRILAVLVAEREDLDAELDAAIRQSPKWCAQEKLLRSVPGVGPTIARTLIAEMPELGALDRRRIAALAGLAPWTRESGQWKGRSMIGGGRREVRAALFMGAMVACRRNEVLTAFYERLVAAGKPKPVAHIAVARRLLTILNAIVRDGKPWNVEAMRCAS